jgi:hypothetical protein
MSANRKKHLPSNYLTLSQGASLIRIVLRGFPTTGRDDRDGWT